MASDDTTKTILFATLSSTVNSFAGNALRLAGISRDQRLLDRKGPLGP